MADQTPLSSSEGVQLGVWLHPELLLVVKQAAAIQFPGRGSIRKAIDTALRLWLQQLTSDGHFQTEYAQRYGEALDMRQVGHLVPFLRGRGRPKVGVRSKR